MNIGGVYKQGNTSNYTATVKPEESSKDQPVLVNKTEQHQEQHHSLQKINEKEKENELTKEEAKHIVKGMNEFLEPKFTSVTFKLHEDLDRYYVEVIDKKTKEVVREIPDKEILDMYAKMTEYLGLFIDEKL